MIRRSPDLIVLGIAVVIALRASLWLTSSEQVARFIVVRLLPLWIIAELALLAGVIACAYALVTGRAVYLFGQPANRQIVVPLLLLGFVALLLEIALWLYASGAA